MKRERKSKEIPVVPAPEDTTAPAVAVDAAPSWDGPTRAGDDDEIAGLAAESLREDLGVGEPFEGAASAGPEDAAEEGEGPPADGEGPPADGAALDGELAAASDDLPEPVVETSGRLESILESLLYAADRALTVSDLKRLVNERDTKKVAAALESLRARHADTGIQLASLAGGWQFRTHPENGPWVAKLIAGRPQRLSRAMLETLAIVAYRQPITRPEIDEIRGVDCGPVLKTLLDRAFIRILGKKEDVGRPMLYGTTPEFLRTFSLRDLTELPTLREFHELSEQQMAHVDSKAPLPEAAVAATPDANAAPDGAAGAPARSAFAPAAVNLSPVDQDEEDDLLAALDEATLAASRAAGPPPGATAEAASEASEAT